LREPPEDADFEDFIVGLEHAEEELRVTQLSAAYPSGVTVVLLGYARRLSGFLHFISKSRMHANMDVVGTPGCVGVRRKCLQREVEELIEKLAKEWPGQDYDLLTRNCCHFADTFCIRLSVGPIPRWVKSLAGAGSRINRGTASVVAGIDKVGRLFGCCSIRVREPSAQRLTELPAAPQISA